MRTRFFGHRRPTSDHHDRGFAKLFPRRSGRRSGRCACRPPGRLDGSLSPAVATSNRPQLAEDATGALQIVYLGELLTDE